jgi:DNA polymerase I-like protein with 3'-5' exonuclease and polymerase domains
MRPIESINRVLIDRTNWEQLKPTLLAKVSATDLMGFDIETHDEDRHEGLNALMKIDDEGHRHGQKLIFDTNRTTVTGFSIYPNDTDTAYYFNLAQADAHNRLNFSDVRCLFDSFKGYYVIHNAAFEIVMMEKALNVGYKLPHGRVLDSMILCVTAYNSDTYSKAAFSNAQLTGLYKLIPDIKVAWAMNDTETQENLIKKFCAKESDAAHSYNGFIKDLAWGYNLKKASKSWLGYTQKTFEETLGNKPHMGCLTGAEVVHYGADDAITCVQLYHTVLQWLMENNPAAINTYFNQENPCCWVYAQMNATGMRVNVEAIYKAQDEQRIEYAVALRKMQTLLAQAMETYTDKPSDQLIKYEKWYEKPTQTKITPEIVDGRTKYLWLIKQFISVHDKSSDYELINFHVRSPVGKGWSGLEPTVINLSHYMPMRVILFDILGLKAQVEAGKIQSDSEARAKLAEKSDSKLVKDIIETYTVLGDIEQGLKLYINNYIKMLDPDTGRMYPTISSLLDTRRTSTSNPSPQQLTKFGKSKYVRSFFLADDENSVILAPDFSAIELVIIGGYSNDPAFIKAYGQRPHADLHSQTAAFMTGVSLEEFLKLPNKKQIRNEVGKPSGFGYFYSGSLSTVGRTLEWDRDKIQEMTERFRTGYAQAEQWRLDVINTAKRQGYIELPDHLRRYRFESTQIWADMMQGKFDHLSLSDFGKQCIRKIQNRSANMAVNAGVQGLCATYAKRKMYRAMFKDIPRLGLRARVMTLVHDELVVSVHRDDVLKAKDYLYELMIDGEGIFDNVVIDSSMAMGRNYLAFNAEKNPKGLVELMEIDKELPCIEKSRWGQKATDNEVGLILDYMFN